MSAPFSIHFSVDRFTANYSEFNSYAKVYLFNPANSELEQLGETVRFRFSVVSSIAY